MENPERLLQELPPALITILLGLASLAAGAGGFVDRLALLLLGNIPFTGLLFFLSAWVTLSTEGRRGENSFFGTLMAAGGFVLSLLSLLLNPAHPWIA